jgi:signal peptidase I
MDWFRKRITSRNFKLLLISNFSCFLSFKHKFIFWFFLVSVLILTILFRIPAIADNTMEPTLNHGRRVLVLKKTFATPTDISRGKLIAYRNPSDKSYTSISRITGIAGDSIRIIDNFLFINGEKQTKLDQNQVRDQLFRLEPGINQFHLYSESLQPIDHWVLLDLSASTDRRNFPQDGNPLIVPPNSIFVMGDNRNQSLGTSTWGVVNLDDVVGSPLITGASIFFQ